MNFSSESKSRALNGPHVPCCSNAHLPGVLLGTVLSQSCNAEKEREASRSYFTILYAIKLQSIALKPLIFKNYIAWIASRFSTCSGLNLSAFSLRRKKKLFFSKFSSHMYYLRVPYIAYSSRSSRLHHSLIPRFHLCESDGSNRTVLFLRHPEHQELTSPKYCLKVFHEENQVLGLGTGREESMEEGGLLLGTTHPAHIFNVAR